MGNPMNFTDRIVLDGTHIREDGYLVADARVARTGIQLYAGHEVGQPEKAVVRVYRAEDEVFSRDTLASFAHRPVTNDHPSEAVTADNWREHAVGQSGDEIARDGSFIRVPLMVADAVTIKDIQNGKRELSAGYKCELIIGDGVSPDGEAYDAVQKNIRANHVAVVSAGRAGRECRIGDGARPHDWGAAPIYTNDRKEPDMPELRKMLVDGLQVETTDAGAQAIQKLQDSLKDSAAQIEKLTKDNETAIAAKDSELAKKDAEIDDLKSKVLDAAALDARVRDRAALVSTAQALVADIKIDGLSDADIRKAVVKAKFGDAAIADKTDAYVDARFDILAEDAKKNGAPDPVSRALQARDSTAAVTQDHGQSQYEERQRNAWKRPSAAA